MRHTLLALAVGLVCGLSQAADQPVHFLSRDLNLGQTTEGELRNVLDGLGCVYELTAGPDAYSRAYRITSNCFRRPGFRYATVRVRSGVIEHEALVADGSAYDSYRRSLQDIFLGIRPETGRESDGELVWKLADGGRTFRVSLRQSGSEAYMSADLNQPSAASGAAYVDDLVAFMKKISSDPKFLRSQREMLATVYGLNEEKLAIFSEMNEQLLADENVWALIGRIFKQHAAGVDRKLWPLLMHKTIESVTTNFQPGLPRLPEQEFLNMVRCLCRYLELLTPEQYKRLLLGDIGFYTDPAYLKSQITFLNMLSVEDFRTYVFGEFHAIRAEAADYPPKATLTDAQRQTAEAALERQLEALWREKGRTEEDLERILASLEDIASADPQDIVDLQRCMYEAAFSLSGEERYWAVLSIME